MPNFIGKIYVIDQQPSPILAVYQCGWQQCGPNHSYGPGIWDHYVIHYIIKGKGEFTYGGKTYPIQAGQGFMISPNTTAYYRADSDDPWEYHWVGFNGTEARKMLEKAGIDDDNPVFSCKNVPLVGEYMERLYNASKDSGYKEYAMIGYLYLIFSCIIREPVAWGRPAQDYIENAAQYIEDRCFYRLTVEDVAGHVGIERSYLYRIFKRELGCSVSEYIQKRKINKAQALLLESNITATEIANSLCFDSVSHFSKAFKRNTGLTPTEYRKKAKEKQE